MTLRAAFKLLLHGAEKPEIHDRLVVVLKDDMIAFIGFEVGAVYLSALVFCLPECPDVEIVPQDLGHGNNAPCRLCAGLDLLAVRNAALFVVHTRGGDIAVGEEVRYLAVAIALGVHLEYLPDDLGAFLLDFN